MTEKETHPQFPNFVQVSHIDVDSGSVWIGDPCYIIRDSDKTRPTDLGSGWSDVCSRFFERSGYREQQKEWRDWNRKREDYLREHSDWKEFRQRAKGKSELFTEEEEISSRIFEEFEMTNPYQPTVGIDKGFANFNHDQGHPGMGTMTNTFYGDGSYPVYIEYGEDGRPRRVLIDFDPGGE